MTCDEYRAFIRALGLTPIKPSHDGATLHQDRDGEIIRVIDPEGLSEEEREGLCVLIQARLGITLKSGWRTP